MAHNKKARKFFNKVFDVTVPDIKLSAALARVLAALPLRHRYVLTRHNRLRLRYTASCAAVFMAVFALSSYMSADSGASYYGVSSPVSERQASSLQDQPQKTAEAQPEGAPAVRKHNVAKDGNGHSNSAGPDFLAAIEPESEARAEQEPKIREFTVGRGETLAGLLQKAGLSGGEAYRAVSSLGDLFDPRHIRAGQTISLRFDPAIDDNGHQDYQFAEMLLPVSALETIHTRRDEEGRFESVKQEKEVEKRVYAGQAEIEVSLFGSGLKAGIPSAVISNAMRVFSWDVDFQRDIRRGDVMEVLYEQYETEDGTRVKNGDILYVRLKVNGHDMPAYRFEMEDGHVDYYSPDGESLRKALMRTPVDGARISSSYGMRHHPVLGYSRMHRGTDFAAPPGTPIYAAGDGTIERIGKWGAYGNYVRIRHNSTLKTAYAHLQRFAGGLSNGSRVQQGQIIGYVGATGRVTGPHLHYEVLMNGDQVDPRSVDVPQGETLKGRQLEAFKRHKRQIHQQYARLSGDQDSQYAALR